VSCAGSMNNSQSPTARVIHVHGTHYQMGYQHGSQVKGMRAAIDTAIDTRFAKLQQEGADEAFEALVQETQRVVNTVDPLIVDVIRGLGDGLEIEFERLMRYNLVAFLNDALTTRGNLPEGNGLSDNEGCTTWAATGAATTTGQPILAKNRDYRLEHLPLQVAVRAKPATGYHYTYITSAGSPGVFVAGFNQEGLALVDTHVSSTDIGPGLPTYALSMHILEEHRTVATALDYLKSMPRLGRNNLLMADANGDIALFELGHANSSVLTTETGLLVNTNHFISPVMQPYFVDTSKPALRGNTLQRYKTVETVLNTAYGHIDTALAQQLMASP
jgi:isopenicillin-N N-acyltransferase-like protein